MSKETSGMWHETYAKEKTNKVVVKLKNPDDTFKKSIILPTDMYPLNSDNFRIFTYKNTEFVSDECVHIIFNSITYKPGHCYQNAKALADKLKSRGYNAKTYVGWLFVGKYEYPVHHCWVVLDENKVLDLSDDFSQMLNAENSKHFVGENEKDTRALIVDFCIAAKNWPNSMRCYPLGTPTAFLYYVGCECDADEGRRIYQRLIKQFPDHECQRNCDKNGLNATQRLMRERGVF